MINEHGVFVQEPGKRGEICVRGPRLMNGYLGNPKASADSFIDGWLKTGDIGRVDKQGRIFIVDRQKVWHPCNMACSPSGLILRLYARISSSVKPNFSLAQ